VSQPPRDEPPPYSTVVFDCDSTLSAIEGVDELASLLAADMRREIEELTRRAMAGELPLEAVYAGRLDRIRPHRRDLDRIGRLYVERAVPGGRELVATLHALAKQVWIVSGGLRPAVLHLGRHLGIPDERVLAVETLHDPAGTWLGYAADSPLARSGGKPPVVARIARGAGPGGVAMVGDGVTDLEAAPHLRRFVAFGGVVRREPVFAAARVTAEAPDLMALLPLLVAEEERARLARN
jgi:phosphoserine phosphatase